MKIEIDLPSTVMYSYHQRVRLEFPDITDTKEIEQKSANLIEMDLRRLAWT